MKYYHYYLIFNKCSYNKNYFQFNNFKLIIYNLYKIMLMEIFLNNQLNLNCFIHLLLMYLNFILLYNYMVL
jgi:hypothetical protein